MPRWRSRLPRAPPSTGAGRAWRSARASAASTPHGVCRYSACFLFDERHLVFECPALQYIRDNYPWLFHVDTMRLFMWQADIIGVAKFIMDCFAHMHAPIVDDASDDDSI